MRRLRASVRRHLGVPHPQQQHPEPARRLELLTDNQVAKVVFFELAWRRQPGDSNAHKFVTASNRDRRHGCAAAFAAYFVAKTQIYAGIKQALCRRLVVACCVRRGRLVYTFAREAPLTRPRRLAALLILILLPAVVPERLVLFVRGAAPTYESQLFGEM